MLSKFDQTEDETCVQRKPGSGGANKKVTTRKAVQIEMEFNHQTGKSQRKTGEKLKISAMAVNRTLRKSNIKYRKRQGHPEAPADQYSRLQNLAKNEIRKKTRKVLVMDDESYFTFSGCKMPSNAGYYSSDPSLTPRAAKEYPTKKFESKVMVWCAISSTGISKVFVANKGQTINKDCYQAILKSHLIPFIDKKCGGRANCIFWPDLASSHYASDVQTWMGSEGIKFIKRENNPPNCPQLRPIEHFWSILKQLVYANDFQATSREELIKRIKTCLKKIDVEVVKNMMQKVPEKIHLARTDGL